IGVCIPRPVNLERTNGLTAVGVAQVGRDAAVLVPELLDRIKGRVAGEVGDRRIQAPARDEQQREARAGLLKVDANGTFFVEGHGSSFLLSLLSKHSPRCGHRWRRSARCQYGASVRIHQLRGHTFPVRQWTEGMIASFASSSE